MSADFVTELTAFLAALGALITAGFALWRAISTQAALKRLQETPMVGSHVIVVRPDAPTQETPLP